MRKDMMNDMAEMLEEAGVKNVRVYDNGSFPGMGIHEMGTARMGTRSEDVGPQFAQPGVGLPERVRNRRLFMASSACHNPSLGYMAFTARASAVRGRRTEARQPVAVERIDEPNSIRTRSAAGTRFAWSRVCWGGAAIAGSDLLLAVLV
jgi:hypothetical protein